MQRKCPECGLDTEELTCPNDGEMTLVIKKETKKADNMVGQIIGGRYRVEKIIGQGGFGAVYMAQHIATGDQLAIKVLRTDVEGASDVVARFRQEAKATSRLKHPNTVRVFDFGQMDDGNLFLAMEFLDGKTLTDVMRAEGPLAPERLVKIGVQVLKSLSEAHSKGLVHRDLKPDNIFIQNIHGEPDFVRVLDFGIAKSLATDTEDLTSTGAVIGTPKYMSPEQARGQSVDARTDIYSLGVILFEGISGTPPFMAETPLAMILRRVTEEPPHVHDSIARPTPIGFCDVVLKSLSRRLEDRYESADAFAEALQASLDTPVALPGGGTSAVIHTGAGGSHTAAYGSAPIGDETVDVSSEQIVLATTGNSSQIMVHSAAGDDDATFEATAEQMAAAAAAGGSDDVTQRTFQDGPATEVTPVVGGGAPPPSASAPAAPAPTGPAPSAPDEPASKPATVATPTPSAPTQVVGGGSDNKMPLYIGGGIGVIVIVLLIVMMSRPQQVVIAQGQLTAGGQVVPVQQQAPAPAPAPAPEPKAEPKSEPKPEPEPEAKPEPVAPAAPRQATVVLVRTPQNAAVTIDGSGIVGEKSLLPPGKHKVQASADGFEPWEEEFEVAAGETRVVRFELVKKAGPRPARKPSGGTARPEPKPVAATPKPEPKPEPKPVVKKPVEKKPPPSGLLID